MIYLKRQAVSKKHTFNKTAALFLALFLIDVAGYALAAAETRIEEIIGQVISLDTAANMLTVKTRQGEMSFFVDEKTQITMGREEKLFSDIKIGEKVKVHYTTAEGKELAEKIMMRRRKTRSSPEGVPKE